MRINSIRLVNYRRFADLTLDFRPGMNVIAGINGSGKTSILTAVCTSFAGYLLPLQQVTSNSLEEEDVARVVAQNKDGRVRFEPQYPVRIEAVECADGRLKSWTITRPSDMPIIGWEPSPFDLPGSRYAGAGGDSTLPLLLFYRARRNWSSTPLNEVQAVMHRASRMDAYSSYHDASVDAMEFQQWLVAKSVERYQTATESKLSYEDINGDELDLVNRALGQVIDDVRGIRFDMRQKRLILEWGDSSRPASLFDNLSDGQKSVIGIVADVARRLCLLNPHLGSAVLNETPGVVLIDELDIHLHPIWQRAITRGLPAAFPAIQFIAASHSPLVLGELKPEQIILLHGEQGGHPQASYGLDSNRVLEEIMGAKMRTEQVEQALEEIFALIEQKDLARARDRMKELALRAPELPELNRANALIRRKEVVGR